jgi:hypothetical protein
VTCTKGSHNMRVKVDVFLDIPAHLVHNLSKGSLRSKDVKIDGAGWDRMLVYCTKCGVSQYYGPVKTNGT